MVGLVTSLTRSDKTRDRRDEIALFLSGTTGVTTFTVSREVGWAVALRFVGVRGDLLSGSTASSRVGRPGRLVGVDDTLAAIDALPIFLPLL